MINQHPLITLSPVKEGNLDMWRIKLVLTANYDGVGNDHGNTT